MNRIDGNTAVITPAAAAPTAPILITEHEVMLATAATVGIRPEPRHWFSGLSGIAHAAMQRLSGDRRPPSHYPKRHAFLDDACLAREMRRL